MTRSGGCWCPHHEEGARGQHSQAPYAPLLRRTVGSPGRSRRTRASSWPPGRALWLCACTGTSIPGGATKVWGGFRPFPGGRRRGAPPDAGERGSRVSRPGSPRAMTAPPGRSPRTRSHASSLQEMGPAVPAGELPEAFGPRAAWGGGVEGVLVPGSSPCCLLRPRDAQRSASKSTDPTGSLERGCVRLQSLGSGPRGRRWPVDPGRMVWDHERGHENHQFSGRPCRPFPPCPEDRRFKGFLALPWQARAGASLLGAAPCHPACGPRSPWTVFCV